MARNPVTARDIVSRLVRDKNMAGGGVGAQSGAHLPQVFISVAEGPFEPWDV